MYSCYNKNSLETIVNNMTQNITQPRSVHVDPYSIAINIREEERRRIYYWEIASQTGIGDAFT